MAHASARIRGSVVLLTISSGDHAAIAESGVSEEKVLQPLIGNAAKMTPPLAVLINRLRKKLAGCFVIMIDPILCL
jgi:hypothetical protein